MQVYLSYTLAPGDVVWPGEPTVEIHQFTSVEKDGYNSYKTLLPNHHGTHYDAPNHFNAAGPKITELPMDYFWFDRVCVLDLPKEPGQGVTREDLEARRQQIGDAQLLLFKTGFARYREEQPRVYEENGPFFYPEACVYLVENFPALRCIGMDFLSIGSPSNKLSPQAHRTLFGCHNGKFVTGIEDMDLRPLYGAQKALKTVIVAPLRLVGVDSSQVTVFGVLED